MKDKTIYKSDTGEIIGHCSANATMRSFGTIDGYYNPEEYFVNLRTNPLQAQQKQPFPAVANKTEIIADNKDEVIISRVPLGCTCTLDGEPVIVTEELITFTAEHVGTYVFNFSMFPYLDGTITITGKAKDENTGS